MNLTQEILSQKLPSFLINSLCHKIFKVRLAPKLSLNSWKILRSQLWKMTCKIPLKLTKLLSNSWSLTLSSLEIKRWSRNALQFSIHGHMTLKMLTLSTLLVRTKWTLFANISIQMHQECSGSHSSNLNLLALQMNSLMLSGRCAKWVSQLNSSIKN